MLNTTGSLSEQNPQASTAKVLLNDFLRMCKQRKIQYDDPQLALERSIVLAGLRLGEENAKETPE